MRGNLLFILGSILHLAASQRQCDPARAKPELQPGQCVTTYECRGKDGKVVIPTVPSRKKDCDYAITTFRPDGSIQDECCTTSIKTDPPYKSDQTPIIEEKEKERPRCGKEFGWLECDPDNAYGECCSKSG